jgi:hypothetical protein
MRSFVIFILCINKNKEDELVEHLGHLGKMREKFSIKT